MKKRTGFLLVSLSISFSLLGCRYNKSDVGIDSSDFVNQQRVLIKEFINRTGTRGISFALFTNDSIIWKESIGKTTNKQKVNEKTLFNLQSASKNVTALAVLMAVQDGLLSLDEPIVRYLPNFRVNSCFEEKPETKITLRMLLSNTAGFTHEAPIGNNYDFSFPTIDDHLRSIENTWLMFPAGSKYSYSNLGFDLAAKIVETASRMKFSEYLRKKVFQPLSMNLSTVSDEEFIKNINRTEGIISSVKVKHYPIPLIGSGCVYTSVDDLIKYIQFHLNYGQVEDKQILDPSLLRQMCTINLNNYGLGTYIDVDNETYYLNHNGGGFGYGSSLLWFPEYHIGAVVVANNPVDCYEVASSLIRNYLTHYELVGRKDTLSNQGFNPINEFKNRNKLMPKDVDCKCDSTYNDDWDKYLGNYKIVLGGMEFKWYVNLSFAFGNKPLKIRLGRVDNSLMLTGSFGESKLKEFQPGLFFTQKGEVLDLRGSTPTYKNLKMKKY